MTWIRLLTAAAAAVGLALSGSVSKADFVITHSRTSNAFTLNSQSYDIVTFLVVNDGVNGTGTTFISVDAALYTPSAGGMLIGVGNGHTATQTQADVFGTNPSSWAHTSWIGDNTAPFSLTDGIGGSVLLLGANPITTAGVDPNSQTFTANQSVQGIAGTMFTTGTLQPAGDGMIFGQAVVQHDATVTLLNPVAYGVRAFEPTSGYFSSGDGNTVAGVTSVTFAGSAIVDVPEPASLALVGIGAAGLLPRRWRLILGREHDIA